LNEGGTTTCRPFWRGRGLLFCMIIFYRRLHETQRDFEFR